MTYAGRLAVATPSLTDGNFDRTVVLLLAHSEADGALGVVLNRVSRVPVAAVLPDWADAVAEPTAVFSGGPVQPEVALCVAMARAGEQPPGWSPLTGRLGTIDFGVPVEEVLPYVERARLFAGYAGWSPGQLEAEIAAGAWLVFDLLPGDPFTAQPAALWAAVLRRQGGLTAAVAQFPKDPALN